MSKEGREGGKKRLEDVLTLRSFCLCLHICVILAYPTDPFTTSEACNQEIGEFYVAQERRTTDFKASKL